MARKRNRNRRNKTAPAPVLTDFAEAPDVDKENALTIFKKIKEAAHEVNDDILNGYLAQAEHYVKRFELTGQVIALAKTVWLSKIVTKEFVLTKLGYNKACLRTDIEKFIDQHPTRVIKVANISDYERDIPDEALRAIQQTKDIFSHHIIVYTDHTRKATRAVKKARDPILFGVFRDEVKIKDAVHDANGTLISPEVTTGVMSDRLYMLASWEDEFCDLTWPTLLREGRGTVKVIDLSTEGSFKDRVSTEVSTGS